jgi:hypothetical protein
LACTVHLASCKPLLDSATAANGGAFVVCAGWDRWPDQVPIPIYIAQPDFRQAMVLFVVAALHPIPAGVALSGA